HVGARPRLQARGLPKPHRRLPELGLQLRDLQLLGKDHPRGRARASRGLSYGRALIRGAAAPILSEAPTSVVVRVIVVVPIISHALEIFVPCRSDRHLGDSIDFECRLGARPGGRADPPPPGTILTLAR